MILSDEDISSYENIMKVGAELVPTWTLRNAIETIRDMRQECEDYKSAMKLLMQMNPAEVSDWPTVIESILKPSLLKHVR